MRRLKTNNFKNLATLPLMVSVDDAAKAAGLPADRLRELAEAGYAPHYRVDGGPPLFRTGELRAWVKENLVQVNEGIPMPRAVPLWLDAEKLGFGKQPPVCLRGIDRLHQALMPPRVCGVYFLCKGSELVYVGQSTDIYGRAINHRARKDFDEVFYLSVPASELDRIEGAFIRLLKPCLNGNVGPATDSEALGIVAATLDAERKSA